MNSLELTSEISQRWQLISAKVAQWSDDWQAAQPGGRIAPSPDLIEKRVSELVERFLEIEREWSAGVYRVRELLFELVEADIEPTPFEASIKSLIDSLDRSAERVLETRAVVERELASIGIPVPNPVGISRPNTMAALRGMRELAQCVFGPHHSDEENRELEAVLFPA